MSEPRTQPPLKVEPVRRYRRPGYPTSEDFDPAVLLAHPYPFSSRFRTWVTTFGASSLLCSWVGAEPPEAKGLENPLTIAKNGLPYRSSPFGTGMPSYISEDLARQVIERVFREAGYELKQGEQYRKGDVVFTTSGYDPDARVGYVWGDWESLDRRDAIIDWSTPKLGEAEIQNLIKQEAQDPAACSAQLERLAGQLKRMDPEGKRTKAIDEAMARKSVQGKAETLALILDEIQSEEGDDRISLEEMKALEERKNGEHDFIAVINRYDLRFASHGWDRDLHAKQMKARQIENEDERRATLEKIEKEHAAKGLKELEEAVSDYLSWARSQGLQN